MVQAEEKNQGAVRACPGEIQRLRNLLGFAFLFSLAAETLQYLFAVGIFDIDDVVWNTLGAALGWGIYRVCPAFAGR